MTNPLSAKNELDASELYLLKFKSLRLNHNISKFLVSYDPDVPCIYLSVFAQLNRIALSDGSCSEIKLNIVP